MLDSTLGFPDLKSFTVKNIKEWAKNNDIKAPSGLRKAELIEYLEGAYAEKNSGNSYETKPLTENLSVLQPRYVNQNINWIEHLFEYGWTVVPIPNWDDNFTDMFLNWFESCSPNFDKTNHTTWKRENLPIMLHGILKHYFGHTELQWLIRELCVPIFSELWNCPPEDLLCSFDGGCFLPSKPKKTFKKWIHVDMPRDLTTLACVQGIVNFEESNLEDGGIVLVEGSHLIFGEYMKKYPSEGIIWNLSRMNDPLLTSRNLIKICAPKGSLILFDSRTFHCGAPPFGSILRDDNTPRFRLCLYVSMQPRSGATEIELKKRQKMYEEGRMTGHWCYGHFFKANPLGPRLYGSSINNKPEVIEIAELNPLRMRLIGY